MVDDRDLVANLFYFAQQMARKEYGLVLVLGKPAYERTHFLDASRIEAVGGFVQDDQFRVIQQHSCDPQTLLHAGGVIANFSIGAIEQVHIVEQTIDEVCVMYIARARQNSEVLPGGHKRVEIGTLHQSTNPLQSRRIADRASE